MIKSVIDQLPKDSRAATAQELGLWYSEDGLGVIAYVGDDKAEFLAEIINTLKMPIEVEEV